MLAVASLLTGCQISIPFNNKSGTAVEAARDAEVDIRNGRLQILIQSTSESADFKELKELLRAHDVGLKTYFPQTTAEGTYFSAYNKAVSDHLKRKHGRDVYLDACSEVYQIQYYGREELGDAKQPTDK